MTKHVIVGYDGTESAREAVAWAANEAAALGTSLRIVSCYDVRYADYESQSIVDEMIELAQHRITDLADNFRAKFPNLPIATAVVAPPPAGALIADATNDDLIVVGASAHRGAGAFWLGSVPRAVVRGAVCPVVVVRGAASRGRPDRIVVGVDASDGSDDALLWACDEADLHQVPLVVVHAWEYPYVSVNLRTRNMRELTRIDAARVLERNVEQARERCGSDVADRLAEGSPGGALLDTARDGDLIVIGSRGRSAFTASLLGSTANSLLDEAAVPVVVVHPRDRAERAHGDGSAA
jgi:nucleotide-binding universal stress UspA family protein